jgi:hypothetical protein
MSLKTKDVTITAEGRDKGRTYRLTEMPALKAERWARRAVMAMSRQELDIRSEIAALGMWGFVLGGMQALAAGDVDAVDQLMDEMLPQIQIIEERAVRPILAEGDVWEVMTYKTLRQELIELHLSFTLADLVSILRASAQNQADLQNTSTSQTSSETSSQPSAEG